MKKETLVKAKELEEDIRKMENALKYYKQGRWSNWDINDSPSTFHFAFHKHYGEGSAYRQNMPCWLNGPLMEVVERELDRCKAELENLGEDKPSPAETYHDSIYKAEDEQDMLPEEPDGRIDIKEAVESMYYHTKKANLVWWTMVGVVALLFAADHTTPSAMVWVVASLLFGLVQHVWQGVALEYFVRKLDHDDIARFDQYPNHISNGGWVFYVLKMIAVLIAIAVMVIGWTCGSCAI